MASKLILYAYCGMSIPLESGDREEMRISAAKHIRKVRASGHPVSILESGSEWEVLEPDGSNLIPDSAGILRLETPVYDCPECGYARHVSQEDARTCCNG